MPHTCIISSNPDVSGIGVRISIYVLTSLAILLDYFDDEKQYAAFCFSKGLAGIAILLTAIVQSALKKLSLFHHHTLVHYFLLLILPFFCSRNSTPRSTKFLYVLLSLAFELWVICYMSASEHGIVGGPCEQSTKATTWMGYTRMDRNKIKWHTVGITAVTVGQLVYMLFVPMIPKRLLERCGSYRCVEWLWLAAPELLERWEHYCCRVWLVFRWVLFAAGTILWVIFVTFNEFMIAANQVEDGEREWSFGQMLSVSMLLAPTFDCIRVVIGDWWTRERQVAQRDRSVLEGGIELQTIRIDAA